MTRRWRSRIALLLRHRVWVAPVLVLGFSGALAWSLVRSPGSVASFAAAAGLGATAFAWGYTRRARETQPWPLLTHLKRRQYRETWDALSASYLEARFSVAGAATESTLRESASAPLAYIMDLAGVRPTDDVLEIACGVGRIGRELAPRCRSWAGADISGNMLAAAAKRLGDLPNVRLHQLDGHGLTGIDDHSLDVVYCTNAIGHIDDIDRWRYAEEAFRVLRPGGRVLFDNIDLSSDAGWAAFLRSGARFAEHEPMPYVPRFSTPDELTRYFSRAGFQDVTAHGREPLVIAVGVKPDTTAP